ncbi:uncharacterized protein LACBIDRAFT_318946 [Laccaria bicolor S238N-H82]|uniref:Predicted protein n=1 Tax=Laccaria bicolor (strain S238N-H82 / ATCC MYA-4686) TaxID=486041 RepID=B0D7I0_LACBS|nr:uncharacterized protein LACBIDRAFT_318946 [Laccaria bicolor S238N-H82]EDR09399.1 predicted protein [Laccaria bicolor S238N-H82]|eukprot:XP_001879748.1 predicted protein [Laccaria bicolor S238N-H82]
MPASDSDTPLATSQTVPVNADTTASTTSDGPPTTSQTVATDFKPVTVPTDFKPVTVDTASQKPPPISRFDDTGGAKGGDFLKMVQKEMLKLFNPTAGQTFAVQFPGRFLQESLYAWDTDAAGIYGQFSKPTVVNESEFRLVDQLYDVGQVVGAPNGSNLSIVYEQIINNLVPGFNDSQANLAKQQDRIRKWLLKEVPAAPWVKDLLEEQHSRNGSSSTNDSDGSFAVSNKLDDGKVNRMELAEALMEEYLTAKSAWELERDKMIRETKPENMEDLTRTLAHITAVREAQLSAKYADAVVLGYSHTIRQYLGYMDIKSPAELLQDAKDSFRESSASSLDGSMKVYPVQMSPVDWYRSLSTSFTMEDLTSDPDAIQQQIDSKSKQIDALQTRLAFLQGTPKADLDELKKKLDSAQSAKAQAEADLSSTYNTNVVSLALTFVSTAGIFLMSEFVSAATTLNIVAKLYDGIEGAMKKTGEAQVAVINASRAYTTLLAEIAAAQAADSNLEDKQLTLQINALQRDVTELTTRLKSLRFDASGDVKPPKDTNDVKNADVPNFPPGTSGGSRWQEIIISHETSNMFQTTDKSSYAYSEDSGLSFWWGGYSESSSDSGADDASHLKQSSFKMEIGFRATMVTVDRGGWFQPQFFKQSAGFYHIDKRISWGKWPDSIKGAHDLQNAPADVWDQLDEYLMPAFPTGYVMCKDITIKVAMDETTHDSDSSFFQSQSASAGGILMWSTSSSSSESSSHQMVSTQVTADGLIIRIPGPQIMGYMFEIMPNDLSDDLPQTIPDSFFIPDDDYDSTFNKGSAAVALNHAQAAQEAAVEKEKSQPPKPASASVLPRPKART